MLKNVSIPRPDAENPGVRLPASLSRVADTKTKALGILMDFDHSIMNGLATYSEMPDHQNLLVAEYARNRGILTLSDAVLGKFQIPGCETSDGRALVFLSNVALREVPELAKFLESGRLAKFPLGESYVSAIVSLDESDSARHEFLEILSENFSRSASSPLKQDIIPALVEAGWVPLSEKPEISDTSDGKVPNTVRPISKTDRMKARKYSIGENADFDTTHRYLRKHLAHYSKLFASAGEEPSSVHLTVSGKSANTAVIRFVQSRIDDHSKIDVHPGYFFLNEGDFSQEVPSVGPSDAQALFLSIDAGYAGMGGGEAYFHGVSEKMERLVERARENPDAPYFLCIDVTSDLSGISDRLSDFIKRRAEIPNLTVFLSSSLTKYNRSERNYHYGIVAEYSTSPESFETLFRDSFDLEKSVSTSYGDLSPLGILQFPRLRLSSVKRQRENCEANRKAFMEGFSSQTGMLSSVSFRFEHYSAYSYLVLDIPSEARNHAISAFLEIAVPAEFRGSSFYHEEVRFCDVPEIGCSRFTVTPGDFLNCVRIAWPDSPQWESMEALGRSMGKKFAKAVEAA